MPFDPRQPFTRADALAAGLSDNALRGRGFVTLLRGVYVSAEVRVGAWERAAAALRAVGESACVTGLTAVHVLGLPAPAPPEAAEVAVPTAAERRRRAGLHVRVAPGPTIRHRGLRLRHPASLFVELAGRLTLVDLVVLGDAMVRKGLVTCADLRHAATSGPDPSGLAGRAADLVRERVDSPMESRLRMLLVLAGLPEPTVDHQVRRADGTIRYRFDLSYPVLKVAIEYDGQHHRADLDRWDSDVLRHDWFTAHGWLRVDVVARGIFQRPGETVDRVARVLVQRGWRGRPTEGWRPHFPERAAA
ncbi:MAG: hypothetical protein Q8Q02_06925 [Nocardioides sp.]|nr:hypothetical protein [Nocardioides sp.]